MTTDTEQCENRRRQQARWAEVGPALLEALKAVEWGVPHYWKSWNEEVVDIAYRTCPSCDGPDRDDFMGPAGHFPDCQLAAAIAQAEGETA